MRERDGGSEAGEREREDENVEEKYIKKITYKNHKNSAIITGDKNLTSNEKRHGRFSP